MTLENKKTPPTFGERLRLILSELKLKQTEFAKSLGISANYVYLLTSGKKKNISEPLARLIESTYGYSVTWLLTGEGERLASPRQRDSLKNETIDKVRRMSVQELKAVAAFVRSLEDMDDSC